VYESNACCVEGGAKTQDDDVCCRHVTLTGDIPASLGRHAISQGVCSNILKGILHKNGHETHQIFFFVCKERRTILYDSSRGFLYVNSK
jgi:hypothetical protein